MYHATGLDVICLIAILIFCADIVRTIIHKNGPSYATLAARVAELEGEREKIRPALREIIEGANITMLPYTTMLDKHWPEWREFAKKGAGR